MPTSPRSSPDFAGRRALVVGHGSIGRRHVDVLAMLGCDVAVVSRRDSTDPAFFSTIDAAITAHRPDYIVIANETSAHCDSLNTLAGIGFGGEVLVEKPLFDVPATVPEHGFTGLSVAYNLRFHPGLRQLRDWLRDDPPLSAAIHVGQYLPTWRPDEDYRRSYSADRAAGGGALRDLSHDLDYACWLLGPWQATAALGGRFSDLEITSDDLYALLMQTENCPVVTIEMNYLDRQPRRTVAVNGRCHSYELDLVGHVLRRDDEVIRYEMERNSTYSAMHHALLDGDRSTACTVGEGLIVQDLIDAAERAAGRQEWVKR